MHDVKDIDLSSNYPTFSDAPLCDIVEEDHVDEEFQVAWIELEKEMDKSVEEENVDLGVGGSIA